MKLFDYIFYRVAKKYYKRDGRDAFTAVLVVSIIQIELLADLFIILTKFFVPPSATTEYIKYGRILGIVIAVVFLIINYFYFKGKYWIFSNQWKESETPSQHFMRGCLVILAIISPVIIFILFAIFAGKHS
ncbi:MAG TPA: hypothetical protein VL443_21160 [Cyclobacteriaceae bacterium]|jgi:hypothetical protein|nr:hypothetical protein [Cyclobacteriaceae bacterium]